MTRPVKYERDGAVVTITLNDGRANALSTVMQAHINDALDTAEKDDSKALVLAGNDRLFCGGFDLSVIASGDRAAILTMLNGGFELAARLLMFPKSIVIAATGPAIAMGSFLLLTGDYRIGSTRSRCHANEVALGMALPTSAIEILRMRLTPSAFQRATMSAVFEGDAAVAAGWLDEIVDESQVLPLSQKFAAESAAKLDLRAHAATKARARNNAVLAIRAGLDLLADEFFDH